MLKEYLGDNTYKYTLTSGSEVILTDDELEQQILLCYIESTGELQAAEVGSIPTCNREQARS